MAEFRALALPAIYFQVERAKRACGRTDLFCTLTGAVDGASQPTECDREVRDEGLRRTLHWNSSRILAGISELRIRLSPTRAALTPTAASFLTSSAVLMPLSETSTLRSSTSSAIRSVVP